MIQTHGAKLARLGAGRQVFSEQGYIMTAHLLQAGVSLVWGHGKSFHQPICPFSRKVRLVLGEKKFAVEFVEERPWERRLDFLMLNPSGEVRFWLAMQARLRDIMQLPNGLRKRRCPAAHAVGWAAARRGAPSDCLV